MTNIKLGQSQQPLNYYYEARKPDGEKVCGRHIAPDKPTLEVHLKYEEKVKPTRIRLLTGKQQGK